MRSLTLWLYVATVLLLSGCVPFPHTVEITPKISGKISDSGAVIKNAEIYLSRASPDGCNHKADAIYRSNENGEFSIDRRTETMFFYRPLVTPISVSQFQVCIMANGKTYIGFRDLIFTQEMEQHIQLVCDIKKSKKLKFYDGSETESICESIKQPLTYYSTQTRSQELAASRPMVRAG